MIGSNLVDAKEIKDGTYPLEVKLWNMYEDKVSMGSNALSSQAELIVKDGKTNLELEFLPLEFNGIKGYLGEVSIENKDIKIISKYENYDTYNDPKQGKDTKMKGIKYPKKIQIPIDLEEEFTVLNLYIPVMEEMGFGNQKARLKILSEFNLNQNTEQKLNTEKKINVEQTGEALRLKNGLYEISVALWNANEDKESMGNKALNGVANIEVDGEEIYLYLETKVMNVSDIQASLANVYIENSDGFYHRAKKAAYDLELQDNKEKQRRIFKVNLEDIKEFTLIQVDPKVEAMGDNPIKARLKLDLNSIKPITTAMLKNQFEDESLGDTVNKNQSNFKTNKSVILNYPEDSFDEDFEFFANKITGEDLEKIKEKFSNEDKITVYSLETLGELDKFPVDTLNPKEFRKKINSKKTLEVKLPLSSNNTEVSLYRVNEESLDLINTKMIEKFLVFNTDKMGQYVVLEKSNKLSGSLKNKGGNIKNIKSSGKSNVLPVKNLIVNDSNKNDIKQTELQEKKLETLKYASEKNKTEGNKNIKVKENKGVIFGIFLLLAAINIYSILIIKKSILNIKKEKMISIELENLER